MHDQLDSHAVKILAWQHGDAESHRHNSYPQLKNSADIDASVGNDFKTDVVKPSNEEGNWNRMSEDSLQ